MSVESLVHFDTNKDIVITCDASQYGVGAVMSHIINATQIQMGLLKDRYRLLKKR